MSPINLYGATKLCAEKLLIQGNSLRGKGATLISAIRYGNVAGSRGSVIPLFNSQRDKEYITITDKNSTRFWITLDQGVESVRKFVEIMKGGEIFVPKMPSIKIIDLAEVLAPGIKIKNIGLRPGEKLHEDLISQHEARNVREFKDHYIIGSEFIYWNNRRLSSIKYKKVVSQFSYNSNSNTEFLTKPMLHNVLKRLGYN